MKKLILIAAVLIVPSALPAQPGHAAHLAPGRAHLRGWSAQTRWRGAMPRSITSTVAHVVTAAKSDPSRTGSPAAASAQARSSAPRALSGRGSSQAFSSNRGGIHIQRLAAATGSDDPQPPAPAPTPVPPYDYTPGALIRTAGLGYTVTPTNDAHYSNNDPGYAIVQDPEQAPLLNPCVGVHMGPPDKYPTPNPVGHGNASGRNAITPND
jgi:hypothetical protein